MIKYFTKFLIIFIIVCLFIPVGCRKLDYRPTFKKGALPDTIFICKNGYQIIPLDSIIKDEDDPDSSLEWSITAGSLIIITLRHTISLGRVVELKPILNQIGNTIVTFTATDPLGYSASKTCIAKVESVHFELKLHTLILIQNQDTTFRKDTIIQYKYRNNIDWRSKLKWNPPSYDTTVLTVGLYADSLTVKARDSVYSTGIYFTIEDTMNHVIYNRSTLVFVQ